LPKLEAQTYPTDAIKAAYNSQIANAIEQLAKVFNGSTPIHLSLKGKYSEGSHHNVPSSWLLVIHHISQTASATSTTSWNTRVTITP